MEQSQKLLDVIVTETEAQREKIVESIRKPELATTNDRLGKLGFKTAVKEISRQQRLVTAYEKYMFVMPDKIEAFNEKLRKETLREDKNAYHYKKLVFIPIEQYDQIPPEHVLDQLDKAVADGCFDRFEVCKIDWIKEVKDPIVFGRIDGCSDYFFIAQWDDDIKIEDILFFNK